MTRLYGWGKKSARVNDYVPDVRFEKTSIIATLCKYGVNAPIAGTIDEMVEALKTALDSVNKIDIINWFKHYGYYVNV